MGGFSIWHWIILLLALGIPATIVGLIIWLAVRASGKSAPALPPASSPAMPASGQTSTGTRLQELAELKSRGLITASEYEQKRAALLREL